MAFAVCLVIGGVGFALIPFLHDQYLQFVPFLMIGAVWAAKLAMPFTFVTNALQGYGHMGASLGLFNGTICIPQIVAAICGGTVLSLVGSHQSDMMIVAGILLIACAASLGLFNGTICIPQIVAAICGGTVLSLVGSHQSDMMIVAGILLIACALSSSRIRNQNKMR